MLTSAAARFIASKPRRLYPHICVVCGVHYQGKGRSRYCSRRCQNQADYQRHAELRPGEQAARPGGGRLMKVWVLHVNEGVDRWDQRDHTLVFSSKARAHQYVAETQAAAAQEPADWLTQENGAQWASADGYYWELCEQAVDSGDVDEAVA